MKDYASRSAGSSNPIAPSRTLRAGRSIPVGVSRQPPVRTLTNFTYLWKNSPNVLRPSMARSTETLAGRHPAHAVGEASKIRMSNLSLRTLPRVLRSFDPIGPYVYEKKVMRRTDVLDGAVPRGALLCKPSGADPPTMGDRSPRSARHQRTSPNSDMRC